MRYLYATSFLAFCSLLLAGSASAEVAPTATFEGKRVVLIGFEPVQQPLEPIAILNIVSLKTDSAFRAADVRTSIERLYATGRYRDIKVDASPLDDGVAIRFITTGSWFVGRVTVESEISEPPSVAQMTTAVGLDLGTRFDEEQARAGEQGIQRLLHGNGYFSGTVSHKLEYDPRYQQVAVLYSVQPGKRTHYSAPEITGDTADLTESQLANATRWRRNILAFRLPGYRGITQNRTRAGIDNVREKFHTKDRLLATVTLESINEESGQPYLRVNAGPVVEISTTGAKMSRKNLKKTVPVFEERTVDADLLVEGEQKIRDYFQSQGYFEVGVDLAHQERVGGRMKIVYEVTPGERHRLIEVITDGNKYFDAKTIRERLYVMPKSFELRRGRYSDGIRRRDEETIRNLYRTNGFRDVQVTSKTEDDYKGKQGDFAVYFSITEGPQYMVESLRIEGGKGVDLNPIIGTLNSQSGQVFSDFNVAADRETILRLYGANGFSDATFEWDSQPSLKPNQINLRFQISEGEQKFIRNVLTTGLHTTRPDLVDQMLLLNPGDPMSPTALAETQKKLYDLGIFAQVNMAIQNPDGDERQKYVLLDLNEARRYSVTAGFGAEFAKLGGSRALADLSDPGGSAGFSPRVSVGVSRLNFLGLGQTLGFQGRLSTFQRRGAISYFVPRIANTANFDANFSILYDDTHDVRTFRARRQEASAQLVQRISRSTTYSYRFNYRNVGVGDLRIDPLLLPRLAQTVRVGIASFNLVQDRRDDPTDAHKGIYNTLEVGTASKVFGSQTNFLRVLGRNATYYRLGQKFILARETQVGIQKAWSIPANADPSDPIPLPERFYGGGGNTQRGFPENQAGTRDLLTGFPLGGSALFFNNIELRFPLLGANISGVLFEDAGNIYSSIGKMSLRTKQKDLTDFNYMVHAAGFGVRYRTPVGPIRFDLAYSINPPRYNGFPGSYVQLVQCSAAGTCQAAVQRISHFQFFFSIGQAF
ncbi:MAG: surface antigen [Bryobacterales bacterium]|nr:surface antigen [Bryobacterales bacterium]